MNESILNCFHPNFLNRQKDSVTVCFCQVETDDWNHFNWELNIKNRSWSWVTCDFVSLLVYKKTSFWVQLVSVLIYQTVVTIMVSRTIKCSLFHASLLSVFYTFTAHKDPSNTVSSSTNWIRYILVLLVLSLCVFVCVWDRNGFSHFFIVSAALEVFSPVVELSVKFSCLVLSSALRSVPEPLLTHFLNCPPPFFLTIDRTDPVLDSNTHILTLTFLTGLLQIQVERRQKKKRIWKIYQKYIE